MAADEDTPEAVFNLYQKQVQMGTQVDLSKITPDNPRLKLFDNLQADAAKYAHFRQAQKEKELIEVRTDLDKQKIEKKYKNYRQVEEQTIFAHSAAAERWMGFEENADIYPNLEYRTAGDSDVRAEHAKLDGIILPMNDPFWSGHTPPLGWGCRCELVQTDDPVNKDQEKYKGFEDTTAPKGFDFNPGVEQKLFSDSAGYYTSFSKSKADEIATTAQGFYYDFTKQYGASQVGKIFGKVKVTKAGIKQAIEQPHRDYTLKNMLLENLKGLIKGKTFKPVPGKEGFQYAPFNLNGKNSYVVVQEKAGKLEFTTISDTLNF